MMNQIVTLKDRIYNGSQILASGHDNIFVEYDLDINASFKIKLGLLVTKTITRNEAIDFLDDWSDATFKPTFEMWWPLNESSRGFTSNNFKMSQIQSVELLPQIIKSLELDCLYDAQTIV